MCEIGCVVELLGGLEMRGLGYISGFRRQRGGGLGEHVIGRAGFFFALQLLAVIYIRMIR